jgi:hypothetical protein
VCKREKEAGMPEGKEEDKIKIPRIKNAETEHAGIKCAGTDRNCTEKCRLREILRTQRAQ